MPRDVWVLDSGIGGLSILKAIQELLPDASYAYCADYALAPYGEASTQAVVTRLVELTTALLSKAPARAVVVACNTASTVGLEALRSHCPVPVIGVVPAVKPAAQVSQSQCIGVLGTPITVAGDYLNLMIQHFCQGCGVHRFARPELVKLVEDVYLRGMPLDQTQLQGSLEAIVRVPSLDTLVLACTHFPWLKTHIQEVVGPRMLLLDSAAAVAQRTQWILHESPSHPHILETPHTLRLGAGSSISENLLITTASPELRPQMLHMAHQHGMVFHAHDTWPL